MTNMNMSASVGGYERSQNKENHVCSSAVGRSQMSFQWTSGIMSVVSVALLNNLNIEEGKVTGAL